MGESSEGLSSLHEINHHEFQFIDEGDSYGVDEPLLRANVLCNGDQVISTDLLSKPVPPKREGDATGIDDVNGHDCFAEKEPIISQSMILGKEANGFDEAAQIEGSEEDISSNDPSEANSGSWCQSDVSESSESELHHGDLERHGYKSINKDAFNQHPFYSCDRPLNGQSNPHKVLYSPQIYSGSGENHICRNNQPLSPYGNNNHYTTDTYKTTFSKMMSPSQISCGLSNSFPLTTASPQQSFSNPIVSGSATRTSTRQNLPYENPPFGSNLDEQLMRESALKLMNSGTGRLDSPRGMPRAEPILDAMTNETGKKKKKKKKRTPACTKGDSSDAVVEKRNGLPVEDAVPPMEKPATYPPVSDTGASVMDHEQRKFQKSKGAKKKKKAENVMKAKEIAGNRGNEDLDELVCYVEGGKKKEKDKDKKSQRSTRPAVVRVTSKQSEDDNNTKSNDVAPLPSTNATNDQKNDRVKSDTGPVKEESDLEFTNFEGLVDVEEETPFERYVGRRKKVRSGPTKPPAPPPFTRNESSRGWGNSRPASSHPSQVPSRPHHPVRPGPATRPPPAKEDFPPLRPSNPPKPTWNFEQIQNFLEQLYPQLKEKCSFYSDAGRRAHHVAS